MSESKSQKMLADFGNLSGCRDAEGLAGQIPREHRKGTALKKDSFERDYTRVLKGSVLSGGPGTLSELQTEFRIQGFR